MFDEVGVCGCRLLRPSFSVSFGPYCIGTVLFRASSLICHVLQRTFGMHVCPPVTYGKAEPS